jgi:hypothetical protein
MGAFRHSPSSPMLVHMESRYSCNQMHTHMQPIVVANNGAPASAQAPAARLATGRRPRRGAPRYAAGVPAQPRRGVPCPLPSTHPGYSLEFVSVYNLDFNAGRSGGGTRCPSRSSCPSWGCSPGATTLRSRTAEIGVMPHGNVLHPCRTSDSTEGITM